MVICCFTIAVKYGMVFEKVLGNLLNNIHFTMSIFKQTNYILLVSIVLLSYACSSTKRIMVEFPQKPKNEISQDIQSLLIVNRAVDNTYSDLSTDSNENSGLLAKVPLVYNMTG